MKHYKNYLKDRKHGFCHYILIFTVLLEFRVPQKQRHEHADMNQCQDCNHLFVLCAKTFGLGFSFPSAKKCGVVLHFKNSEEK